VGELLTSGAYRIEAHELRRLVSGQQTENAFLSAERVWTNLADGSLSGVSIGVDQRRVKGSGRWNITPRGQYCVDIAWEGASANETWCCFVFRRGNAFFGAPSDDPQSGHVHRLNVRAGE
jgi:hypothetical protein